ncbi:MAG: PQQ-like beta-propeller repeat protein [Planctomycetota bacterium]|nr:PQQ-like beta-propeller repeat protein [Planctomycetota bacterium]
MSFEPEKYFIVLAFMAIQSNPAAGQENLTQGTPTRVPSAGKAVIQSDLTWPHLRGPRFDGIVRSAEFPKTINPDRISVLWKRELGQGYSSFTADEEAIYTLYQTATEQYVIALDRETGVPHWQRKIGWAWEANGLYPGPRATPSIWKERIFFAGAFGLLGCLDRKTGKELWSLNVTERFQGKGTEFGYSCTPLVEDGKVFLPVGGADASVVALKADDGSVLWKTGSDAASYCGSIPIRVNGERQIVSFMQNAVVANRPDNGVQIWRHEWSSGYDEHAVWPLYDDPFLLISSPFKQGSRLLKVDSEPGVEPSLAWESKSLSCDVFSCIALDGFVYGFDLKDIQATRWRTSRGKLKCLRISDGEEMWSTDKCEHAAVLGVKTEHGNKLVLFTDTGTLIFAEALSDRYHEHHRQQIFREGIHWTPPLVLGDKVYLRNDKWVMCLALNGSLKASLATGDLPGARSAVQIDGKDTPKQEAAWRTDASISPHLADMQRWYAWSLLIGFVVPALLAAMVDRVLVKVERDYRAKIYRPAFYVSSFLLGALGTHLLAGMTGRLIFTWPISLFIVFQWTSNSCIAHSQNETVPTGNRLLQRLPLLAFLLTCLVYFEVCKAAGVIMGWGFLAGLLPGAVGAQIASRAIQHPGIVRFLAANLLSFSWFFLCGAGFTIWKTHL